MYFLLLEVITWDDCTDRFYICEMDLLPLFSACQGKGQERNSQERNSQECNGQVRPLCHTVEI